jgi:hypothetical protein
MYQAGTWTRPRKVVARLECSLQPDGGEVTATGMRQEVDIRYVVTSVDGAAKYLYRQALCLQRCGDQCVAGGGAGPAACNRTAA